jgi:hypothetical protein
MVNDADSEAELRKRNELGKRNIRHLTTAVGLVRRLFLMTSSTYTLQQRRWMDQQHILQFHHWYDPSFVQTMWNMSPMELFLFIGNIVSYLYVRTLLEHIGFFLSPTIVSLFILAMLIDVGVPPAAATYTTLALMFFAVFIVFLYP